MSVFATIHTELISAMKSKAGVKVSTLRGLKAALQKDAIDSKGSSDDDQRAFVVLKQEAKKRQDSVTAYRAAGRNDQLIKISRGNWSNSICRHSYRKMKENRRWSGCASQHQKRWRQQNFGLLMKQVMQQLDGKADGKVVSTILKQALTVWTVISEHYNCFSSRLVVGCWPLKLLGRRSSPIMAFC